MISALILKIRTWDLTGSFNSVLSLMSTSLSFHLFYASFFIIIVTRFSLQWLQHNAQTFLENSTCQRTRISYKVSTPISKGTLSAVFGFLCPFQQLGYRHVKASRGTHATMASMKILALILKSLLPYLCEQKFQNLDFCLGINLLNSKRRMQASTISHPVLHRHCLLFIHVAILIITFQEKKMKVGDKKENSNNRTLLKGTQKAQKKRDYKHFPTCCPSF